jgi:hypothetical protein
MELLDLNGLMPPPQPAKIQENFFLPAELRDVIDPLVTRHGRKRKWMLYTAALLALLEEGEKAMGERIGRVAASEHAGGLKRLIDEAVQAGRLWDLGGQDGIGGAVKPHGPERPPADGRRPPRRRGKGAADGAE